MAYVPASSLQTRRPLWDSLQHVALVGSYVPRRCGIATFTADLTESIAATAPSAGVFAVAMNDRPEGYRYPPRVWFEINQQRPGEYRLAADFLNMSNVEVCCVQHEFGIYGGAAGHYLLELLRRLRMPVVTTLHTVLREPDDAQREVMKQLAERSDRLVVMAEKAVSFLREVYRVPERKIALVPHGIPDVPFVDPNYFKDQLGVEGRKVILTFGLLGPSKGIDNMIRALPAVVARHPDVVYIVLGATHPGVIAHSGEEYRLGLKRLASDLGVAGHIEFVNKFVELDDLVEYLGAADVYVTPYDNEAQITSGTLAYALGTGKATVSTPYWYAQEMLADGRGKLVPFADAEALGGAITELFDQETDRHAMRKRAYQYTRQMRWRDVAGQYLDLFVAVREERSREPRPVGTRRAVHDTPADLTQIKLDHLFRLTDDTGVLSAAKFAVPERRAGYTTADNARGLVVTLLAHDHLGYAGTLNLDATICRCLSFLEDALEPEAGRFRDRMNYERVWDPDPGSELTHGRAVWALGEAVARCHVRGHMVLAANLFQRALPACEALEHPHGWAYSLIGIHAYLRRFSGDSNARRVREKLAKRLLHAFQTRGSDDWPWASDELTYGLARLPHALLLSGRWMFDDQMIQCALRSLEWLHGVQTGPRDQFAPVGTEGWFRRGGSKARFNQRPIEAAITLEADLEAYRVTHDPKWVTRAERCLNWFLGDNDLNLPLYDPTTGGCADALMAHGISENQGAEATLSWLLALLSFYEHRMGEQPAETTPAAAAEPPAAPGLSAVKPAKAATAST